MTREEEILKAARVYANGIAQHLPNKKYCEEDFIVGAEWADAHPHWISVEDELPKDGEYVATINTVGVKDVRHYKGSKWFSSYGNEYGDITHWMPLPQAPHHFADVSQKVKKGGEE